MTCADHTFITPFHNASKYIPGLVASIAAQTRKPRQWILIDDRSTDDSIACLKTTLTQHRDAFKDVDVHILQPDKWGGVSKARNLGLDLVSGQRVTLLDADDTYEPDFVARMEYLANAYDPDMVILGYHLVPGMFQQPEQETLSAVSPYLKELEGSLFLLENPLEVVTHHDFPMGPGSNVCCKKSFIQQNRYDETTHYFEAIEFWYRNLRAAINRGPCKCLLDMGDFLHIHLVPGSLSRKKLSSKDAAEVPRILSQFSAKKDRYDQRVFDLVLMRWIPNMLRRVGSPTEQLRFLLKNKVFLWQFVRAHGRKAMVKT